VTAHSKSEPIVMHGGLALAACGQGSPDRAQREELAAAFEGPDAVRLALAALPPTADTGTHDESHRGVEAHVAPPRPSFGLTDVTVTCEEVGPVLC
jgi:hypothetical protein